ncbi:hypothetical protein [Microcoleus sp. Pol12A6]
MIIAPGKNGDRNDRTMHSKKYQRSDTVPSNHCLASFPAYLLPR